MHGAYQGANSCLSLLTYSIFHEVLWKIHRMRGAQTVANWNRCRPLQFYVLIHEETNDA